jgi:hypothetical protein
MKYNCEHCCYSTDDRCNWSRHNKSQAHLKKINAVFNTLDPDKFICPYCRLEFSSASCLSRHKNHRCRKNPSCILKYEDGLDSEKDLRIAELERINNELMKNKEELVKQKDELVKDKEYFKLIVEKTVNTAEVAVKTTASAINYVTSTYPNAPVLEPMPSYKAIKDYCGEFEIAKVIHDKYLDNKLIRYLGMLLVDYYKKENPEDQSVWNSDCSRLSYIIRNLTSNKTPIWLTDKKGIELKKCVIDPLLSYIEKELINYATDKKNITGANFECIATCHKIIYEIRHSIIGNELIKFLAPYFHLNRSDTKQLLLD